MLQHTGADEYRKLKDRLGFDPDDVRDPAKSLIAACDYLARAKTQTFIDRGDFIKSRQSVNGGTIGITEVTIRRTRSLTVLM
jgi:predicted chitinase